MPSDRSARPAGADRPATDTRVLLLAPTPRDGDVSCRLLAAVGIHCQLCGDVPLLCDAAAAGAGAVMLPEELVLNGGAEPLAEHLRRQPVWSDLPVIVLSRAGGDPRAVDQAMATLGNVSVVERPVRVNTLLSVVRTALRARERQYQVRDHLLAEQRSAAALRASEERLALAVDAADLGTFHCPLPLGRLDWNQTCKDHFWLGSDAAVDIELFYARIHPDDRDRVRAAVDAAVVDRLPFDVEHRTADVGYRVVPWARGQGVATSLLDEVARFGFDRLALERIQLLHAVPNEASCRVARRAGFAEEAVLRSSFAESNGTRHDEHVHGRLRSDDVARPRIVTALRTDPGA